MIQFLPILRIQFDLFQAALKDGFEGKILNPTHLEHFVKIQVANDEISELLKTHLNTMTYEQAAEEFNTWYTARTPTKDIPLDQLLTDCANLSMWVYKTEHTNCQPVPDHLVACAEELTAEVHARLKEGV